VTAPLAGRTAVVAGASRGIGRACADALGGAGAHVVRLARSLAPAEGAAVTDIPCDLTDAAAVSQAAVAVARRHGAADVLVVAAGSFLLKALAETTPAEFAAQVAGNLAAAFHVYRAFTVPMAAAGRGVVITLGSVADHVALPGNAAYGAAKSGLRGLHGVLAAELAGSGVRATLLSPGPTDTALWDPVDPDARPGFLPRRAMLQSTDVAEAVLFVASRPAHVVIPELWIEPRR
jgi:ribitol 2-dehydrogenase